MRKHKAMLPDSAVALIADIGRNIELARKRRRLKITTVCGRAGITAQTYSRLAAGESGVTLGVLTAVLHAMDLEEGLASLANPATDCVGLSIEMASKPRRIRQEDDDVLDTNF